MPEDLPYLLSSAQGNQQQVLNTQTQLLAGFYSGGASAKFDMVQESYLVQPLFQAMDYVFPLVVGDKGNVIASISTVGGGRIAGYGYDILAGFSPTSKQQTQYQIPQTAHQPVFKRVLAWLVSGNPLMDLTGPSTQAIKVAWGSLPTSSTVMYTQGGVNVYEPFAAAGLRTLGVKFTSATCDPLSAPVSECAAKSQLVVVGATDQSDAGKKLLPTQLDRLKEIIQQKIPILYMNAHPSPGYWNDYARAAFAEDYPRLIALGFATGEITDRRNYYIQDSVAGGSGPDTTKLPSNKFKVVINRLVTGNFTNYDWGSAPCNSLSCAPADFVRDIDAVARYFKDNLDYLNISRVNLFNDQFRSKTIKLLVLWADVYRQTITYPLDKTQDQASFQKAYLADSLVAYVRKAEVKQGNTGNFLSKSAVNTLTSNQYETVQVTLPGKSGFTSVGRFALPGVPISIKFDATPASGKFSFFLNTMNPGSTKVWESPTDVRAGYRRPQYLQSPKFNLTTDELTVVSPYGGTLELAFDSATASSVNLQIKGAAKQPFFDTTQGTPDANQFFLEMTYTQLGWFEIKTPGLEMHSLISNAMSFLLPTAAQLALSSNLYPSVDKPYYSRSKGIDMTAYLSEAKKYVMEDAYQLAGFQTRGLSLSNAVSGFCQQHGWDCTSTNIHQPPTVQHYVSDVRANCGSMCSGNPISSSSAFEPRGWGESHEIGHNLQTFKVYDGISTEVSNNIFPLHKKWRMFRELGRDRVGYYNELGETQAAFDLIKSTYKDSSLSADGKLAKVKNNLWSDSNYAAQNRARLYFYLQWPLIYYEALKAKNPSLSDSQLWDQAWDVFTLMYLHLRQVNAATDTNWPSVKNALGFGTYSSKPLISDAVNSAGTYPMHDFMLVSLSLITGRDQRPIFDLWGITTTPSARNQVALLAQSLQWPSQPVKFYAVACSDDFRSYAAIDLNAANPGYPSSWGSNPFSNPLNNLNACIAATQNYLSSAH